jgi:tRNA dimethylallyltransferase
MAAAEIADVQAQGRLPVLVGGTGLYIRTLLDGIAPVPPIDPRVRQQVRARSVEQNRGQLAERDVEAAARLNPSDENGKASAEAASATGWRSSR